MSGKWGYSSKGGKGGNSGGYGKPNWGGKGWASGGWDDWGSGWGAKSSGDWGYAKGGKGKGGESGKGKGGGKSWSNKQSEDAGWDEMMEEGDALVERTGRIWNRFQVTKSLLRPSADKDGSAFIKKNAKVNDQAFLSAQHMQGHMSASTAHLVRRPGVGLSEIMGSAQSGLAILKQLQDEPDEVGLERMLAMFDDAGEPVKAAMKYLDKSNDMVRQKAETEKHIGVIMNFAKYNNAGLHDVAANCAIAASRMYVAAMSMLQLTSAVQNPQWWAEGVPHSLSQHKDVAGWRERPADIKKMTKAMTRLYMEQLEYEAQWDGDNNAATNVFKKSGTIRDDDNADDDVDEGAEQGGATPRGRSRSKKAGKKSKKKRKRSSTSSSSSSTSKPRKKKEAKSKKDDKKEEKETNKGGATPRGRSKSKKDNKESKKDTEQGDNKQRGRNRSRSRKRSRSHDKKDKKENEKRKSKSRSSSKSSGRAGTRDKSPAPKHIVTIRQQVQKDVFSDKDALHQTEVNGEETVKELVSRFFALLKMEGAIDDYVFLSVTWTKEDDTWKAASATCPQDAPAAEHTELMIQHKGG